MINHRDRRRVVKIKRTSVGRGEDVAARIQMRNRSDIFDRAVSTIVSLFRVIVINRATRCYGKRQHLLKLTYDIVVSFEG